MRERFRLPASRRQMERDLDDELALHASLREEALVRAGMTRSEARLEAARQFGDAARVREECLAIDEAHHAGASRRQRLMDLWQDLTIAWRTLGRDRPLLVLTLLIVAIGVGASTSVFSLYRNVVLRPLPVATPERTLWVTVAAPDGSEGVSPAVAHAWRDGAQSIERFATMRTTARTLVSAGDPQRLEGLQAGEGLLEALGLRALPGRTFGAGDFRDGAPPVVLLSRGLWQSTFGGDPAVVGQAIRLDGEPHTIIGVLPDAIEGLGIEPAFVVPDPLPAALRTNLTPFLDAIAIAREGQAATNVEAELQGILENGARAMGQALGGRRARATPLGDHLTAAVARPIALMLAAVAAVLLIGCANVTGLLLARGSTRARELAVRSSLGATRARLVRQLATEHILLALAGGVLGLVVAWWGTAALVAFLPQDFPRLSRVRLDGGAVAFALAATGLTALVTGVLPAFRLTRMSPGAVLRGGGRGISAATDRTRRGLVIAEVALSTVLLVGSALLLRSAAATSRVSPGFDADSVATARYSLPAVPYQDADAVLGAHARILAGLREQASDRVALSSAVPLGSGSGGSDFRVVGQSGPGADVNADLRFVTPGYLRVMGIPLVEGRDFDDGDTRDAPRRVIVSETLARRLGLGTSAVGRLVGGTSSPFLDSAGTPVAWEIVGVVREPRDAGLRAATVPQVFIPLAQTPAEVFDWAARAVHIAWRISAEGAGITEMRRAVSAVDPNLALFDVRTMRERLRAASAFERASTTLLTALGLAAAFLALAGLHAVVSYHVRQREPEFGVRQALGARPTDIVRLVVGWGGRMAAAGLALGIPASLMAAQVLESLLFGVEAGDLLSIVGAATALGTGTLVACAVPARRASRVPPQTVLRGEG